MWRFLVYSEGILKKGSQPEEIWLRSFFRLQAFALGYDLCHGFQ